MRRICLWLALFTVMITLPAHASFGCVCSDEKCSCFIQRDDGNDPDESLIIVAISQLLFERGYLMYAFDSGFYTKDTENAVRALQKEHDLPQTGTLDDATLTWLIWNMSPEALDKYEPHMIGKPVWVPTDGGIKYHRDSSCSQMLDPRLISHRNAIALGIAPCRRCNPTGLNTILP